MIAECEEKMCIMSSTDDIMHIFFASNENFAMHLTAVLSSILLNANDNDFHFFHILVHRPTFFLQLKFYRALYKTYLVRGECYEK